MTQRPPNLDAATTGPAPTLAEVGAAFLVLLQDRGAPQDLLDYCQRVAGALVLQVQARTGSDAAALLTEADVVAAYDAERERTGLDPGWERFELAGRAVRVWADALADVSR